MQIGQWFGRAVAAFALACAAIGWAQSASAQLLGTTLDATVTVYGGGDTLVVDTLFNGPVVVGSGVEIDQSFSIQLTQGGYSTPSNVFSGTVTVDISASAVTATYVGQAQPYDIEIDLANITPSISGQGIVGLSLATTGFLDGVNYPLSPSFTANSISYLGFGTLGYQPGTNLSETASLTFGAVAVPEPSTYALMLAGLGLLGVAARRRRR